MRKRVDNYAVFWNAPENQGSFLLYFADETTGSVLIDSPQEGMFILDILRNESPVYVDDELDLIVTGIGLSEEE